ncbi:hypothetical protein TrRE_jg11943 [Triparma retinervis]|uniref:Inositolphosphotransferase Aur1/Ipt1 domain-containing protein n=1 Tax=Triparma retinervis TaxID=2557542 RepID=A0A9W7G7F0_9STRA|nr:hypothetical protein TrRE_jg11943 [Triparma retinervis]
MHNDMESATDASLCTPYTLICRNSDSSLGSTLEKVEVAPTIEDRVILFFVKNGLNENIAVRLVVSFKQTVYIGLGYGFYSLCRIIANQTNDSDTAYDNAHSIINFENSSGFFTEKEWQELLVSCTFFANNTVHECEPRHENSIEVMEQLNHFYAVAIWVCTSLFFITTLQFAPRHYPVLAWWFCITSSLAAVTFAAFPCAPPRLVKELHIVDALEEFSGIEIYGPDPDEAVAANPYAAFPSMHTGWSALCSLGVVYVVFKERSKGPKGWLQVAAAFFLTIWYPLLTIFTIVVTGNHFWLDAIGGLVYVLIGWIIAKKWLSDFGRMKKLEVVVYGEARGEEEGEGEAEEAVRMKQGISETADGEEQLIVDV